MRLDVLARWLLRLIILWVTLRVPFKENNALYLQKAVVHSYVTVLILNV